MTHQPTLTDLLRTPPEHAAGLVVAYSGGRDSTALLHALAHAGGAAAVRAVHVCHHIEAAAEDWAAHCAQECADLGVAYSRLDVHVGAGGGGLEAAARHARYAALADDLAPGEVLLTAHHANDQAETFVLQALRGSGVAGLAGMPGLTSFGPGRLWRPWIDRPRAEITAYAKAHGLAWVEDRSNHSRQRARGQLRTRVWPALVERWPAAAETLARSAAWAAQANDAVRALAALDLAAARTDRDTLSIDALATLSPARRAEVLRRWLREAGHDRPNHRHLAEIARLLGAREHAGPRVSFAGTEVRRFDARLFAMPRLPAAPPAATVLAWHAGDAITLPPGCGVLRVHGVPACAWPGGLVLAFGGAGARLSRADGGTEALSEYLRRTRVPPWIRERMPRVYVDDRLVALPGRWQHPAIVDWFGGYAPTFVWRHELAGDPVRD
ncbi:tRNA lysidine(34) synthetase TilS [Salinisphaera sp. RV14]|uniref:tRNA lysidine(34) synthetase TilS n=1 Tax=unclassified Salinisphaera TaxID=2649847 RepID=UPI003F83DAFC